MTKSRLFLFLLLAFIAGVAIRSFAMIPYVAIWIVLACSVLIGAIGISRKHKDIFVFGLIMVAILSGIFRFDAVVHSQPDLTAFYGKSFMMEGVIVEDPERTQLVQRLTIEVASLNGDPLAPHFYTLLTLRRYPEYRMGDELRIQGILEKPLNYNDFDYITYLARRDIFSTMSFPIVEKVDEGGGSKLKVFLSRIKHSFEEKIDRALPEPHSAFLKGLLLGERESLPQELVEQFKVTGTSHIVALSGYNITMVGRFFTIILLAFTIPFQIAFWIATTGIILFVMLTGASPSVVRAGIMGILVLVAQREGRVYRMANALAFAAAVMIFQNPRILRFDAAFQLSFLSTIGLVYLSPRIGAFFDRIHPKRIVERKKKKPLLPMRQMFIETLSAQFMVLSLLIYLFGRVSLISPLSNILVLIAVPYSMTIGFITGVLGFIWYPLSQISGWINWMLLEYKILVIEFFSGFSFASVRVGKLMAAPLTVLYLSIMWKLWSRSKRMPE